MPIVHFYGTLHPKHHKVSSGKAFGISWGTADLGFPLIMEGNLVDSSFEVSCDLPRYDKSMLAILLARAGNLIRSYTDLVSFSTGIGFVLTWEQFKNPEGGVEQLQKVNAALGALCTAYTFPPKSAQESADFEKVLRIVLAEPNLQGSFMDLGDTLAGFHQIPTNCGRVLDSLRKAIAPETHPGTGWGILQTMLRVSRPFRAFITDKSAEPRHGDRESAIPIETVTEILHRTWQITNRFIEFRKRGSVQLPEDEFRELGAGE